MEVKENNVRDMLQKMYNYELTKSLLKVNRKTNGISEEDLNLHASS